MIPEAVYIKSSNDIVNFLMIINKKDGFKY
jgi:DNA-binding transcriptional regulator WhiA